MSILFPFLAAGLFVAGIIALCFHMERERMFRKGWDARGRHAAAHTLREQREAK